MRDDVLEKKLRPRNAIEFGRPFRQFFVPYGAKQPITAEGQVDHHSKATLGGQREDPFSCGPIIERIIDLDEVESFLFHGLLEFRVLVLEGCGDPDVADAARLLHLPEQAELGLGIAQIVHRDEIDLVGTELFE